MSRDSSVVRIAISGGGLAGASLFHALFKQPNLDVHIFESAAVFREAGAAVGITDNAQTALKLVGPSAVESLERAGAVSQKGAHLLLAQGPNAGETVGRIGGERNVVRIVHRAAFLRELLANAPSDRMHASKKLQKIEQLDRDSGTITLHFSDDTKHECDVLIGADGIHSKVRKYVLGESDPAASPVPAGWWLVQVLKPYAEASALLSKQYLDIDKPGEVGWIGHRSLIFHNILNEGKMVNFTLVFCHEAGDASINEWFKVASSEEIRRPFDQWPAELSNAVEKLVCDESSHNALCIWQHLPARTYVRGAVALTGDAAHATTPWQGSGAGMSIEDSLILSNLLGRAKSPSEARVALQVYDSVRRARTQRVVESSYGTGRMATGVDQETGLDAARLQEALRHRWDFILDFDVEKHRDEALREMDEQLRGL